MKMKVKNWSFIENNRKNHISAGQLYLHDTRTYNRFFKSVANIALYASF